MQNLLAIYSSRPPVTGIEFASIANAAGITVRFVNCDVFVDPAIFHGSKEPMRIGKLVCGWKNPETEVTRQFDAVAEIGNRDTLTQLLKSGDVPWFELFPNEFDYSGHMKQFPKDKPKVDNSVTPEQLIAVQAANSRYIFFNQSRRKTSCEFMTSLCHAISPAIEGVVANYVHPGR